MLTSYRMKLSFAPSPRYLEELHCTLCPATCRLGLTQFPAETCCQHCLQSSVPGQHLRGRSLCLITLSNLPGCSFSAYSWKLPAYSEPFYLQLTILASLLTVGAFSIITLVFILTVGACLLGTISEELNSKQKRLQL